jgi:hypothetical protein
LKRLIRSVLKLASGLHRDKLKSNRVFGQKASLLVDVDVVAIVVVGQAFRFHDGVGSAFGECEKLTLEVDVLSLIAWGVDVGDIGGDELLPDAQ